MHPRQQPGHMPPVGGVVSGGGELCVGLTGDYLRREDEWKRREMAPIICGETFSTQ